MALAVISGVIGAIGGALKIAKAFSTQSGTEITKTGSGAGFWNFYSNSNVATLSLSANRCGEYIDRMVRKITKFSTPALQKHTDEIIENLQDIKDFESYGWGDCDNMVNTVDYHTDSGSLFIYIYTFSPFIHPSRGEGVKIQTLKIIVKLQLAKDWMIVSKVKASFFKTSMKQEIQYIPNKGIKMEHIIEAISIAMAPAVLGLVQLPERFMTMLDTMLKDQQANPDKGIVTAPTAEQTAATYERFKEMQAKQDSYEENAQSGFKDLGDALAALGKKPDNTTIPSP